MLTVHHLGKSQSERIVWLCEELAIPHELKRYDRDPQTMAAPPAYKALHPLGAAPVVTDGDLVLAESGAIVEYLLGRHGDERLSVGPEAANFADYLYWLNFTNGTLQPALSRNAMMRRGGLADDHPLLRALVQRTDRAIALLDERLSRNAWCAGDAFTAADIMLVFTLTTMRYFAPFDLAPWPAIRAYLRRVASRPAYRAAMEKGDPGMPLLLD